MNPEKLIRKARRAVESAQLLYEADDVDGACSRAYYAMFDAARAALRYWPLDVRFRQESAKPMAVLSPCLVSTWSRPEKCL